jgi:hypothetical protein
VTWLPTPDSPALSVPFSPPQSPPSRLSRATQSLARRAKASTTPRATGSSRVAPRAVVFPRSTTTHRSYFSRVRASPPLHQPRSRSLRSSLPGAPSRNSRSRNSNSSTVPVSPSVVSVVSASEMTTTSSSTCLQSYPSLSTRERIESIRCDLSDLIDSLNRQTAGTTTTHTENERTHRRPRWIHTPVSRVEKEELNRIEPVRVASSRERRRVSSDGWLVKRWVGSAGPVLWEKNPMRFRFARFRQTSESLSIDECSIRVF